MAEDDDNSEEEEDNSGWLDGVIDVALEVLDLF